MSIEAYQRVWGIEATGNDRVMLFALADHMSAKNGYTCWASIETLAEMVGVGVRAAKKILRRLEANNHIEIETNRGRGNTNIYRLKGEQPCIKGERTDTFSEEEKVNAGSEKVNSRTEKVNAGAIKGERTDTQYEKNLKEPKKNRKGVDAQTREHPKPPTPISPRNKIEIYLQNAGVSDLVWPIAHALSKHAAPVSLGNLAEYAESLFGYDATVEEIQGISNGYWGIHGIGPKPYPKQVETHLHAYREWVEKGKPAPQAKAPVSQQVVNEPAGYAALREWAEQNGVEY